MNINLATFVRVSVATVVLGLVAASSTNLVIYDEKAYSIEQIRSLFSLDRSDTLIKTFSDAKSIKLYEDQQIQFQIVTLLNGSTLPLKAVSILKYLELGGSLFWTINGKNLDGESEGFLQQFGLRSVGEVFDKHKKFTTNYNPKHALTRLIKKAEIASKGLGMTIIRDGDKENSLIHPFLAAEESARCNDDDKIFGDQIVLAATMDTAVGGRVFICNSAILADNHFVYTAHQWTEKKNSIIKLDSFDHHQGNTENSDWYIVNGNFEVSACFSENGKPIQPQDVQVELKLQHTRQRITLKPSKDDECLHGTMKVPDIYGRYTLLLEYIRPGLPLIKMTRMINVRPQWLDQVPKFVMASLPYYVGWQLQLFITCVMLLPLLCCYGVRQDQLH